VVEGIGFIAPESGALEHLGQRRGLVFVKRHAL
jgi:hypothetical protein